MTILDASQFSPLEGGASFSLGNRIERLSWKITWLLLARWTPAFFSPWRILLLRLFGAQTGRGAAISADAKVWLPRHLKLGEYCSLGPGVDCYTMAPISIGHRTIISQGAYLCAGSHDISDPAFQLIAKAIVIGDQAWVAAEAFVAPGVTIEDGAVLSARGCAFENLKAWTVYRGNPAIAVRARVLRQPQEERRG